MTITSSIETHRDAARSSGTRARRLAAHLSLGVLGGLAASASGCGGASVEVQTTSPATAADPLDAVPASELFRRGQILAQHGDFVRAEQYLLASRNRGFDEAQVMPVLMEVCVRASRLSAAIGYAEPYLESHPAAWPLRILVGSIHLGLGHLGEARTHLEHAIRDGARGGRPEPAEAHYLLGIVLREQTEFAEARAHFARYAELEPTGSHAEEVTAILAEPEPRVAVPVPPAERPATVPVRLPSAGPAEPSVATEGAPSPSTQGGTASSGGAS